MPDVVIPACTVPAARSHDGLDHIIPAQAITHRKQWRRCVWCAIAFRPRPTINAHDGMRQRFCGKSCKARQGRATQLALQADKPNHLREVIMEQLGRLTPRSAVEVHRRVWDVWGEISDRAICRHLSQLNKAGLIRRTPDGYLLSPAPRQSAAGVTT